MKGSEILMGFCEKVKVDRVFCDEIFFIEDDEVQETGTEVPIGEVPIPPGSEISGDVTVTVLDCNLVVEPEGLDVFRVNLELMVQKELEIDRVDATPSFDTSVPLEFGFRLFRTFDYRKCTPSQIREIFGDTEAEEIFEQLRCHIVFVDANDRIALTPGTEENVPPFKDAFFEEELDITVKMKLVQEVQLALALCPGTNQVTTPAIVDLNGNTGA